MVDEKFPLGGIGNEIEVILGSWMLLLLLLLNVFVFVAVLDDVCKFEVDAKCCPKAGRFAGGGPASSESESVRSMTSDCLFCGRYDGVVLPGVELVVVPRSGEERREIGLLVAAIPRSCWSSLMLARWGGM